MQNSWRYIYYKKMETIVVGTDFSEPANNAVYYAVELAKFFGAKLILVNAYTIPVGGYDSLAPLEMIPLLQEASAKGLKELRYQIISNNFKFQVECVSEAGSAFQVLKNVSARYFADLVVMGLVGKGSFVKRHLIGSSAIQVARHLHVPLLIIPQNAVYRRIRRICFACDLEKNKESPLFVAAKYFAQIFDAELDTVTVKEVSSEVVWEKSSAYDIVEKPTEGLVHKNVYIRDNDPSSALEYYFKHHQTDLVMVNPKKHHLFATLFSESVTQSLAFEIEVPMLILH